VAFIHCAHKKNGYGISFLFTAFIKTSERVRVFIYGHRNNPHSHEGSQPFPSGYFLFPFSFCVIPRKNSSGLKLGHFTFFLTVNEKGKKETREEKVIKG